MSASLRILFLFLLLPLANADVLVVANTRQPLDQLSLRQLKDLYLGRQPEIANSVAITVLDQRNGQATRQLFYQLLFGKNEAQIDAYWARLEFAGHISPLPQMADDQAVIQRLQKDPSAIGFVQSHTLPDGLKTLLVITTPP